MTHLPFAFRSLRESDEAFIYNSFLKSYYQNSQYKLVPKTLYYQGQSEVIKYLLQEAQVLILCFPEDENEIIGYVIYQLLADNFILHYLYLKQMHRGHGVARETIHELVEPELIIVTHLTQDFVNLRHHFPPKKFIYDPFFLTQRRLLHEHS